MEATRECNTDSIALSGGLDSSILAYCLKNKKVKAFVVATKEFPSTDLVFAQRVAQIVGLKLHVVNVALDELLLSVEQTIKILKVFNPIEIRNNVVLYLVMKAAKEGGCHSMMTGDGSDELFAGYNFLTRLSMGEVDKDLKRIWKIMHFPSRSIAKSIGLLLHTPFLNRDFSENAKRISPYLKIREENGKKYGKWILRKAFESSLPPSIIWREKSAMQDGSGTSGLTSLFNNLILDSYFNQKIKYYLENDMVTLQSKESLFYYEIYKKYFDVPVNLKKSTIRCPKCNFAIKRDTHFCRMCGSYPI